MKRAVTAWGIFAILAGGACCDGQEAVDQKAAGVSDRLFFPRNSVRGYVDFQVAPPHNEVDLGLCTLTTSNPWPNTTCSGYARYVWSGYLEVQPTGRGQSQRVFLFFEPKVYGGENVPQQRYTASASLILWEANLGVGFELPRNFELRLTHHEGHLLGRYGGPDGAVNLRTSGPYGQNSTVGVRWYFGGWGHTAMRAP
jgi:hypothetical protein